MQGLVARPMVEQEGHGVTQDLPKQPASQVPQILGPHPLYAVASGELRKNGVYPVAKSAEQGTSLGIRVELLGGVRSQQLDTHRRQLLLGFRRVVVAVCDDQAGGGLDEFGEDAQLVGALAGAIDRRVTTPGQQTLACILKP